MTEIVVFVGMLLFLGWVFKDSRLFAWINKSSGQKFLEVPSYSEILESESDEKAKSLIYPSIMGPIDYENFPEDSNIYLEEYVGGLKIGYKLDEGDSFRYLSDSDFAAFKLDKAAIREISLQNLSKLLDSLEVHSPYDGVVMFVLKGTGGNFEADLLLLDRLWQDAVPKLLANAHSEVVVIVPTRDLVFFTVSENKPGLAFLRNTAQKEFENGSHRVSKSLFVRNENGWRVLDVV